MDEVRLRGFLEEYNSKAKYEDENHNDFEDITEVRHENSDTKQECSSETEE